MRTLIAVLRLAYVVLLMVQGATVLLYESGLIPNGIALLAGLTTSLAGPLLSVPIGLRVIRRRHVSRALGLAGIGVTYACTCLSFAVLYLILARHDPRAFALATPQPGLGLDTALYFSLVTITTTGYGDVSPLSGLARLVACWEIVTGLLYQVFVFSLVAALTAAPAPEPGRPPTPPADATR